MGRPPLPRIAHDTVAVGWASVELDRAVAELQPMVGPDVLFVDADRSVALGARCRIGSGTIAATALAVRLVILEPDTEGRLAAFLARSGEGWVATWSIDPDAGATVAEGAWRPGPFGLERLDGRPATGDPFRMLVAAATIEP